MRTDVVTIIKGSCAWRTLPFLQLCLQHRPLARQQQVENAPCKAACNLGLDRYGFWCAALLLRIWSITVLFSRTLSRIAYA